MPKVKDKELKVKERILKAEREKQLVTYKGVPIRLSAGFLKQNKTKQNKLYRLEGIDKKYSK